MTAVGTPAVAVRGLSHRYASERAHDGALVALAGVELTLAEGEFVSLVGPSGCGKTTLLRIVAGLLPPSDGDVRVLGRAPAEARSEHALGLVTQDPGLLPWRSVAANVRLALDVTGRSGDVGALLALVGIERFARYHPRQLSGGMRQRVALARALAHEPRLLLMDEPLGALDELAREQMRFELLRIWEQRRTSVLFVTHSIREAVLLSDRVLVMSGRPGSIVDEVRVPLPRPRIPAQEDAPEFAATAARVRGALAAGAS